MACNVKIIMLAFVNRRLPPALRLVKNNYVGLVMARKCHAPEYEERRGSVVVKSTSALHDN